MKLYELFGKTISSYDEWNGNLITITVDSIRLDNESREIIFSGRGYWGNEQKIYIPFSKVDKFLEDGRSAEHTIIDRCHIMKEYKIVNF